MGNRKIDGNKWIYISLIMICVLVIVGIFTLKQKNGEIEMSYFITKENELRFEDGQLETEVGHRNESEETIKGERFVYRISDVIRYDDKALTWSSEDYIPANYEKFAKSVKTNKFLVYIYNLEEEKATLNRGVDINRLIKMINEAYNPGTILGFADIEGEICYIVYGADNEREDYFWVALSLEDDEIVYVYEDREEFEQIEIFKDR